MRSAALWVQHLGQDPGSLSPLEQAETIESQKGKQNSTHNSVSASAYSLSTCSLTVELREDANVAAGLGPDAAVAEDAVAPTERYAEHFDYKELDDIMTATYSEEELNDLMQRSTPSLRKNASATSSTPSRRKNASATSMRSTLRSVE